MSHNFSSLCLYLLVECAWERVGVCVTVCAHVEARGGCLVSSCISPLGLDAGSLSHWPRSSPVQWSWLAGELKGPASLGVSSSGVKAIPSFFTWILGIWTWVLMFLQQVCYPRPSSKHITPWSICPALLLYILFLEKQPGNSMLIPFRKEMTAKGQWEPLSPHTTHF